MRPDFVITLSDAGLRHPQPDSRQLITVDWCSPSSGSAALDLLVVEVEAEAGLGGGGRGVCLVPVQVDPDLR